MDEAKITPRGVSVLEFRNELIGERDGIGCSEFPYVVTD